MNPEFENCPGISLHYSSGLISVVWHIGSFTRSCQLSPAFHFMNEVWKLKLNKSDFGSSTSIIIRLIRDLKCDEQIPNIFFRIWLCDISVINEQRYTNQGKLFKCIQSSDPEDGIILLDELVNERKELVLQGRIEIFWKFRADDITAQMQERTNCSTSNRTYVETLTADFGDLLKERKNCDVSLHLGDEVFQAHKLILGARSSVFADMFDNDLQENQTDIVTIKDVKPSDFGVLLNFMYSGSVQDISIERAIGVYVAADKYDLKDLKSHCKGVLLRGISKDWFFEIAVLAYAHNDGELKDRVKRFGCHNVSFIFKSDKCPGFFRDYPEMAIEILQSSILDTHSPASNQKVKRKTELLGENSNKRKIKLEPV